jgi:hypothetical protein
VPRQTKGIPKKLSLSEGDFLSTFPWFPVTLSLYPPISNDDDEERGRERERGGERDEKKPFRHEKQKHSLIQLLHSFT